LADLRLMALIITEIVNALLPIGLSLESFVQLSGLYPAAKLEGHPTF